MLLDELIRDTGAALRSGDTAGVRITDVVEDSRTCVPGCLFITRRGTHTDGARFITDALDRGAEAVLIDEHADAPAIPAHVPVLTTPTLPRTGATIAERFFANPSSALRVAGVTGTNAKTTVTFLAQSMLNAAGVRCGLIGTVRIDDGRDVGDATLTTPPATELSRTLATMRDHACTRAMLECSSHALDQGRCDGIAFDAAVFTNLSGDHLDYHRTMDAYARAKAHLFELLADGLAIVNADDPYTKVMLERCPRADVLRFAPVDARTNADARVTILERSLDGQRLRLEGPWGVCEGVLSAVGAHNATNALVGACLAQRAGLDADAIAGALAHARMPPGRLEPLHEDAHGPRVFVDYAHTDDALATTLRRTREAMPAGARLIVVFGCGGDRDRTKRPRMGRAACAHADVIVLTSDNPRTEPPSRIIEDVLEGLTDDERARIRVHADRAVAIATAIGDARDADVIIIAGKGHEREQLLPDGAGGVERRPFDDAEHARNALDARTGRASHA